MQESTHKITWIIPQLIKPDKIPKSKTEFSPNKHKDITSTGKRPFTHINNKITICNYKISHNGQHLFHKQINNFLKNLQVYNRNGSKWRDNKIKFKH